MKKLVLLFCLVALMACAEKKKEALPISEALKTETTLKPSMLVVSYEGLEPFLNKNDDKTYVVNFWATWCKPCIKELPYFEELGKKYAGQNVEVLLVSLDNPKLIEKQVIPFIEREELKSKVILFDDPDANTWISKIAKEWTGAIPATILYNKKHRKFFEKSFTFEELETEVKSIL